MNKNVNCNVIEMENNIFVVILKNLVFLLILQNINFLKYSKLNHLH